jgi:CheY-like chemotaxis protein
VSTEILVVDDSAQLAQETAALINVGAHLETGFARDSATALRMVEQYPISVVVLDQRMGTDLSGTQLFQRLREVRPDIRAIMLTGEAGPDEVGQALELGFHDYLPKGRIDELPGRVLLQHVKSKITDLEQHTELENLLLWPRRPRLRLRRGAEIRLVSRRIVEERFVDPASWVTMLQVNAGEERRITHQVARSASIVVEEQSQQTLQASIGLKVRSVAEVTSALQSVLVDSSKLTRTVDNSTTDSTEQTFRLPAEPDAPGPVYVRARLFQRAPVYRKVLVTLSAVCRCCDLSTRIPMVVLQDVGLLATRHEDRMSDQSIRVVETGYIAAQ